jgi:hypothetical protein
MEDVTEGLMSKNPKKRHKGFSSAVVVMIALALAGAAFAAPAFLTANGYLVPDDLRISYMNPDGISSYAGRDPAAAYNSNRSEYLVVWIGSDNILSNGETEVWGQRVHASTGALIGEQIQISQMVPDRDSDNSVKDPQAA